MTIVCSPGLGIVSNYQRCQSRKKRDKGEEEGRKRGEKIEEKER